MQSRILAVLCVFLMALAFGATSCASSISTELPTVNAKAHAKASQGPVIIIDDKSGDPLDERVTHEVYCPCYAMYTDEVI